jgi:hypothetical protein
LDLAQDEGMPSFHDRPDDLGLGERGHPMAATRKTLKRDKDAVNDFLAKLTHNTFFEAIPVSAILDFMHEHGFSAEDPQEEEFILCGREGRMTTIYRHRDSERQRFSWVLTWHKMDVSGRYEVVSYLS